MILNHRDTDDLIEKVSKKAVETGDLIEGDTAVITCRQPCLGRRHDEYDSGDVIIGEGYTLDIQLNGVGMVLK